MNQGKQASDNRNLKIRLIIACLLLLSIFSCVNQRDLEYMRISKIKPPSYKESEHPDYKLRTDDGLYIQISSLDDQAVNVFSDVEGPMTMDQYAAYLQAYIVDKEGYIQLPVIGKIHVSGKTTNEVNNLIVNSLTNILRLPKVTVRLVNQNVTVLGAVEAPGHYVFTQDKFTIFNAISMAGDISVYGNRSEVTLIRNENGMNNRVNIDLTREDILGSPYYFIQPNDVIYVKPLRKRFWGMETFPYALLFTFITTTLLIYNFIEIRQ